MCRSCIRITIELLKNLRQAAAVHKLHHHPQLLLHNVKVNVVDDVAVVRIPSSIAISVKEASISIGERHLLDCNTSTSDCLRGP